MADDFQDSGSYQGALPVAPTRTTPGAYIPAGADLGGVFDSMRLGVGGPDYGAFAKALQTFGIGTAPALQLPNMLDAQKISLDDFGAKAGISPQDFELPSLHGETPDQYTARKSSSPKPTINLQADMMAARQMQMSPFPEIQKQGAELEKQTQWYLQQGIVPHAGGGYYTIPGFSQKKALETTAQGVNPGIMVGPNGVATSQNGAPDTIASNQALTAGEKSQAELPAEIAKIGAQGVETRKNTSLEKSLTDYYAKPEQYTARVADPSAPEGYREENVYLRPAEARSLAAQGHQIFDGSGSKVTGAAAQGAPGGSQSGPAAGVIPGQTRAGAQMPPGAIKPPAPGQVVGLGTSITPENKSVQDEQSKNLLEPANKRIESYPTLLAALDALEAVSSGQSTNVVYPYLTTYNNALTASPELKKYMVDPEHYDPGKADAMRKQMAELVTKMISENVGSALRGNVFLEKLITQTKPTDTMTPEAIRGVTGQIRDLTKMAQDRDVAITNDFNTARQNKQGLPANWDASYWSNQDIAQKSKDMAARLADTATVAPKEPTRPPVVPSEATYLGSTPDGGLRYKFPDGTEKIVRRRVKP